MKNELVEASRKWLKNVEAVETLDSGEQLFRAFDTNINSEIWVKLNIKSELLVSNTYEPIVYDCPEAWYNCGSLDNVNQEFKMPSKF